jgi:extracellular elastinolytic metalloproteinase
MRINPICQVLTSARSRINSRRLWHDPADPTDPFLQADGSDESDIVYHEYTHGLSNRLVVDSGGNSTLGNVQAGSMGEAWSDWYALDFLVGQGFERDTAAPGEMIIGRYVEFGGQNLIRSQPLDCPVGTTSTACPGTPGAGAGGYTYGDFGKIAGIPEVHADGEIWG